MKKRNFYSFLLVLAALLCSSSLWGATFTVDGIRYYYSGSSATTAQVTEPSSSYSGDIVIPEQVTYSNKTYTVTGIRDQAMYYQTNLNSVVIPATVTSLGSYAINYCTKLSTVTLLGTTPPTYGSSCLGSCNALTAIYVPTEVVDTYKNAAGWSAHSSIIMAASGGGSCAAPTALEATQNSPVQATLSWTKAEGKDDYQYVLVEKGATPDWTGVVAQNTNSVVLDVVAGTEYDFYVRTYCEEEDQSAPVKKTFSTTCPAPTSPVVSSISATGATLSWTGAAGISNYQYIVVASGVAQDWTSPTLVEGATTAPLTGLKPSTNYDVYVRSYYSTTTQSAAVKTTFRTACDAVTIPFTWDFSDLGCWTKDENCHSSTGVSNDAFMFYYKATPPYQTLISPEFVALSSTVDVKFDYKAHSTSWAETFALGYSTTTSDLASFTWLSDVTATNTTYAQYEKTLPAGVKYIAIQCKSNNQYYLYIDNFSIAETPACPKPTITATNVIYNGATINCVGGSTENKWKLQYKADGDADWTDANSGALIETASFDLTGLTPGTAYQAQAQAECEGDWSNAVSFTPAYKAPTDLTVSSVTTNTATIAWTANSGEAAWTVQYKKSGDADWTTVADVTTNPYTIEGLSSGSSYQVKVAADALYTDAVDFNTECEAKAIPFTENFDALNCWSMLDKADDTGLYSNAFRFYYNTNPPQYLVSPELATEDKQVTVAFEYRAESSSYEESFQVGYSTTTNDLAAFTWSDEVKYKMTSYETYSEVLPAGVKFIAIKYTANNKYALYIDNISITEYVAPSCAAPTALTVNDVTTNSASVSWTSEASEFSLEYKKTSDEEWTAATGTINSPFALEGLTANETEYTVRVKAICGENNESEWTELAEPFKTECEIPNVTELASWSTNFEDQITGNVPSCWSVPAANTSYEYAKVDDSHAKDGTKCLDIKVNSNYSKVILLPEFAVEAKNLNITFDYNNGSTNSNYGPLEVGYYSGSAFTSVTTLERRDSYANSGLIEMPKTAPADARIAFRVVGSKQGSSYNSHAYIDNITVTRKPACAIPTNLQAVATSTGATLTWAAGDEESKWNVRYSVKDAESWTVLEDKSSGFAITGLEVGTTYEVQVQAYCDEDHQSAWTTSAIFTPVCGAAPTALTVSARTMNSATLTWEGTESAFKLQTSLDGENWEDAIAINAKTYDLISLNAGTTYYVRVQNACGGEYATTSFTTWCGVKEATELPLNITAFTAVPECWEINFVGEYSGIANNVIYFYGNAEQWAILPAYDIELNKLSVTFSFSTNNGSLEFGYIDAPNGTFHAFASQPTSGVELNLENEATSVKYIAVRYTSTSAYASGSISSVLLRKTPTCAKPTDVEATPAVGAATVDWTSEATAWNLQYKLASAAEWTDAAVTAKPFELTGLAQGVSYKVRVQANCGEELSDWSDEATFTTNCSSIDALPYYADFSVALSSCWAVFAQDETYYKPYANTAMNQLVMNGGKEGASNNVVVMPPFSADLTNAVISFEYSSSTGANYAQLEVGYVTDKADAASFVALETLAQSGSWVEARVAAAIPAGAYIAFRYAGASSHGDLAIRHLRVINQLVLDDNDNNSAVLAANLNGQIMDVQIGRTIVCADYFNTLCLPFSLPTLDGTPLEGGELWAFKYATVENDELLFRIIESDHIEAGVPYFIAFPAGENIVNPLFKNVTIAATEGQKVGTGDVAQLCGIIEQPVVFEPGDQTKLFLAANNTLYWWNGSANSQLNNFRAYFKVNTNSGANNAPRHGMRARIIKEELTATGVDNVQDPSQTSAKKFIENDQIVIIKNGVKYNIQGQVIR